MQTLTYGLKRPETGDKGSVFFPALESNFTALDAHNHNGTNSTKLSSSALNLTTQSLPNTGWAPYTTGTYRQAVTMPGTLLVSAKVPIFRDATTFVKYDLSIGYISNTQYYLYCNDPNISLIVTYV